MKRKTFFVQNIYQECYINFNKIFF
ncbi:hypothetical protein [Plasmodium yoelii yoelii]|uniref:Uncharacterized protein n=1 Tax=Plasmodium yoelii yoelii TaxID=73239 RepID=Q7RJY9_PLAYO|nr:hypothetical protein [Plasmodium yoelii yoelii]